MSDCPICCESFNKRTRQYIKCIFCQEISCSNCVKNNIIANGEEKHCIHCGEKWDRMFLVDNFSQAFVDKFLRPHQEKSLVNAEISKLATTQDLAKVMKETRTLEEYRKTTLNPKIEELTKLLKDLKDEKNRVCNQINANIIIMESDHDSVKTEKFNIKCPMKDCNGYLNDKYNCGVCDKNICKDCYEEKKEHHECDPNQVESIKAIKKECKPCPGCGERISKISGCDQMWCIICKKPFSWKTGKVVTGAIHNPEYFRWLNENPTVNPNDLNNLEPFNNIPNGHNNCVVPEIYDTHIILRNTFVPEKLPGNILRDEEIVTRVMLILRLLVALEHDIIPTITQFLNSIDKKKTILRAEYINSFISMDKWKDSLFKLNKDVEKRESLLNIYRLLKIVLLQEMWKIIDTCNSSVSLEIKNSKILESIAECDKIKNFSNTSFDKISKVYKSSRYHIDDKWIIVS